MAFLEVATCAKRAVAGAGDATLTAGLVVRGTDPKRILIRAVGPTLGAFGVGGVLDVPTALAEQPRVSLLELIKMHSLSLLLVAFSPIRARKY